MVALAILVFLCGHFCVKPFGVAMLKEIGNFVQEGILHLQSQKREHWLSGWVGFLTSLPSTVEVTRALTGCFFFVFLHEEKRRTIYACMTTLQMAAKCFFIPARPGLNTLQAGHTSFQCFCSKLLGER